jgi:hypothetical protein
MQVQQYQGKKKFKKLNRVVSTLGKALSSKLYPTLKEGLNWEGEGSSSISGSVGIRICYRYTYWLSTRVYTYLPGGGEVCFKKKTHVGIEPWFPNLFENFQKICLF